MKQKLIIGKLIALNIFYYSVFSFLFWDFNVRNWPIMQTFFGGVFITIFEMIIVGSCLSEPEEEEDES